MISWPIVIIPLVALLIIMLVAYADLSRRISALEAENKLLHEENDRLRKEVGELRAENQDLHTMLRRLTEAEGF